MLQSLADIPLVVCSSVLPRGLSSQSTIVAVVGIPRVEGFEFPVPSAGGDYQYLFESGIEESVSSELPARVHVMQVVFNSFVPVFEDFDE